MFGILSRSTLTVSVVLSTLFLRPFIATGHRLPEEHGQRPSPVVLVPGDGGSQLEAKLDKPHKVHIFCDQKTDSYFNLWLNPNLLFPGVVDCWVDNMKLYYNHSSRSTVNSPGVDIRVPGFGNTTSVEWLDPSGFLPPFVRRFILSAYFVDIADMLVGMGYERGVDIRGAPYDYRKAPNEMKDYYKSVKDLIQETFEKNSKTKVTVICHSMGCPITSYFLSQQRKEWKEKHIKALVSLGGAWAGAVKAMKVIASGENLGILIVSQTKLRTEQRTGPSLAYMMPSHVVWPKDEPLVITENKNYTVQNYHEFFQDMNFTVGYEMYKDTHSYAEKGLSPPGVEVHCIHGHDLATPERLDYRNGRKFPDNPSLIKGNGDGTVNTKSLQACLRWRGAQKEKVHYMTIPNVEHMDILSDNSAMNYIKNVVSTW